jgi:hypothetical protein
MPLNSDKAQTFTVEVDFCLNIQTKESVETFNVTKGETLEFDGLYVSYGGVEGAARSLNSVVGEWIAPQNEDAPALEPDAAPSKNIPKDSLAAPANKNIIVERTEDREIARGRQRDDAGSSVNTSSVSSDGSIRGRGQTEVLVQDEMVVKASTYDNEGKNRPVIEGRKKREVIPDGGQQEVASVISGNRSKVASTKNNTEVNPNTSTKVELEHAEIKTVTAESIHSKKDIGSSTQTKTASAKNTGVSSLEQDQGAVVVGTTRTPNVAKSTEGVDLVTSVGSNSSVKPTVKVSSSEEGVISNPPKKPKNKFVDITKLSQDGKYWTDMAWQAKIKFVKSTNDAGVLKAIKASKPTAAVLKAVEEQLASLVFEEAA